MDLECRQQRSMPFEFFAGDSAVQQLARMRTVSRGQRSGYESVDPCKYATRFGITLTRSTGHPLALVSEGG